jgi:hypothetical protein
MKDEQWIATKPHMHLLDPADMLLLSRRSESWRDGLNGNICGNGSGLENGRCFGEQHQQFGQQAQQQQQQQHQLQQSQCMGYSRPEKVVISNYYDPRAPFRNTYPIQSTHDMGTTFCL